MHARRNYRELIYARYATLGGKTGSQADRRPRMPFLDNVVRNYCDIGRDSSILDLGCGDGSLLLALRQRGFSNLMGVDVSGEQVDAARSLDVGTIVESTVHDYLEKVPDNAYDMVIAFDVIEHFSKDELVDLLGHIA